MQRDAVVRWKDKNADAVLSHRFNHMQVPDARAVLFVLRLWWCHQLMDRSDPDAEQRTVKKNKNMVRKCHGGAKESIKCPFSKKKAAVDRTGVVYTHPGRNMAPGDVAEVALDEESVSSFNSSCASSFSRAVQMGSTYSRKRSSPMSERPFSRVANLDRASTGNPAFTGLCPFSGVGPWSRSILMVVEE